MDSLHQQPQSPEIPHDKFAIVTGSILNNYKTKFFYSGLTWESGKLHKPGTYKDFRPISLLYHLSKITERFINRELSNYVSVDPDQFAYSQGIGTTDALVKFVTEVASMLDNISAHTVQSLYLDFGKAFDLMRNDILATKLIKNNASPYIIKLVLDFLTSRTQQVKSSGCLSSVRNTIIGVPQGTISGPNLWKIYVNDLKPAEKLLKYPDDTTLYSKVLKSDITVLESSGRNRLISIPENGMQHAADKAVEWSQGNKQRLNASKTQYVMFSLQLNN